jgi:hypothetical protein
MIHFLQIILIIKTRVTISEDEYNTKNFFT